jgi:hypothetical protein
MRAKPRAPPPPVPTPAQTGAWSVIATTHRHALRGGVVARKTRAHRSNEFLLKI